MSDAPPYFMAHPATGAPAMTSWASLARLGSYRPDTTQRSCASATSHELYADDTRAEASCHESGP